MWMTINTRSAWTTPFKLTTSELSLQDMAFNFDSLTEENNENVFRLEPKIPYSYEKDDDTLMNVTIERNLDLF